MLLTRSRCESRFVAGSDCEHLHGPRGNEGARCKYSRVFWCDFLLGMRAYWRLLWLVATAFKLLFSGQLENYRFPLDLSNVQKEMPELLSGPPLPATHARTHARTHAHARAEIRERREAGRQGNHRTSLLLHAAEGSWRASVQSPADGGRGTEGPESRDQRIGIRRGRSWQRITCVSVSCAPVRYTTPTLPPLAFHPTPCHHRATGAVRDAMGLLCSGRCAERATKLHHSLQPPAPFSEGATTISILVDKIGLKASTPREP